MDAVTIIKVIAIFLGFWFLPIHIAKLFDKHQTVTLFQGALNGAIATWIYVMIVYF